MFSLIDLIRNYQPEAAALDKIGILDIGAMLLEDKPVEYSVLLNKDCARVVGFEPAKEECEKLNASCKGSETLYLPYFIGDGTRQKFYHTNYSMTSSLYEPNTKLLNMFHNLGELTQVISEEMVDTVRLDDISELDFAVDYIKIDVQGAELQALNGASNKVLKDVLVIQTEVEWVALYKNQPLFSELEIFLRREGFVVHRTKGYGGRSFKPLLIKDNINIGLQHLWSDIVFVRDFTRLEALKLHQLLKTAVILHEIYQSFDLALILLQEYDKRQQSGLARDYFLRLTGECNETDRQQPDNSQINNPSDFVTIYSLGVEAFNRNNFEAALDYFEKARAVRSDFAPLWHSLGLTRARLGDFQEAFACASRALDLDSAYQEATALKKFLETCLTKNQDNPAVQASKSCNADKLRTALELQQQSRLAEAENAFLDILAENPESIPALYSLGGIEHNRQNHVKAIDYFNRALQIKPDYPPLYQNLGVTLQALKQFDKALECYDKAISLDPVYTDAWLNRGAVLADMKQHKDALLNYEQMLKIDPANSKALCNRGILLTDFKLYDLAIETFQRLLETAPNYDFAAGLLCFAKMHACNWNNITALSESIISGVRSGKRVCKSLAFTAISDDPHDQMLCARIFTNYFCPRQEAVWRGEVYKHDKIRVAYISPDFREHPVGHLIAGVFEHHDKSKFKITAISLGIDDQSNLRQRMLNAFDEFIDARKMQSREIAALLREKEIDILVDLAGYTADSRPDVMARRPVPIQVNYLGYSSTMGSDYYDYIIADRHIIPEEYRDCYSEKVVHMPDVYLPTDASVKIADQTLSREEYGLPSSGFVFCSFNHDYKINPPVFDIWMRLLNKIPESVLWLMKLNESAEKNLRKEAELRGVDPARIIFSTRVPRIEDHLARYRAADLFLDTTPCNAHSTASDVLRAGLPIVTCRGKAFAARVASGLLTITGLPDLVTESLEDYENLALKLATDPKALAAVKSRLAENLKTTPLFNTVLYCRNLEQAYIEMHSRYLSEKAPDHIIVTASPTPYETTSPNLDSKIPDEANFEDANSASLSRLHIGGKQASPGWKILNALAGENVDYIGDIRDLSQFSDETFDMIYCSHVIEHIPQFEMIQTLAGINRILKPEGQLLISVPDLEVLCRLFLSSNLNKEARFGVMRMMFGGQVNSFDFHYVGLNSEILLDYLGAANFKFCRKVDKFGFFNDTSSYAPFGVPISLNVIAYKSMPQS